MKNKAANTISALSGTGTGVLRMKRDSEHVLLNVCPSGFLLLADNRGGCKSFLSYIIQLVMYYSLFNLCHKLFGKLAPESVVYFVSQL